MYNAQDAITILLVFGLHKILRNHSIERDIANGCWPPSANKISSIFDSLLGCCAGQYFRYVPTFWRSIMSGEITQKTTIYIYVAVKSRISTIQPNSVWFICCPSTISCEICLYEILNARYNCNVFFWPQLKLSVIFAMGWDYDCGNGSLMGPLVHPPDYMSEYRAVVEGYARRKPKKSELNPGFRGEMLALHTEQNEPC